MSNHFYSSLSKIYIVDIVVMLHSFSIMLRLPKNTKICKNNCVFSGLTHEKKNQCCRVLLGNIRQRTLFGHPVSQEPDGLFTLSKNQNELCLSHESFSFLGFGKS